MEISTYVSYLSYGIYAVIAVFVLFGFLHGLLRGFGKELLSLLTLAISAVASFAACTRAYPLVHDYLQDKTLGEVLAETPYQLSGTLADAANNFSVSSAELILALPITLILLPILFVVLTFVLQFVLGLLRFIIGLIFLRGHKSAASRFGGFILGALGGVVSAALLLFPISALLGLAGDAVDIVRAEAGEDAGVVVAYTDYVGELADHPIPPLVMQCGGEYVYTALTSVNLDGPKQDMRKSLCSLVGTACDVYFLTDADFTALSPENEATLRSLVNRLEENPDLARLVAGLCRALAIAAETDGFTLELGEPYDGFVLSFLHIFDDSDASNIKGDLATLAEVYILLSDNGVLTAFTESSDAVVDSLGKKNEAGDTVINRVIAELRANERTKPLVVGLTKFSVSLMAGEIGMEGVSEETYESVKEGVHTILSIKKEEKTDEEYKEEVKTTLHQTLTENEINVSEEIVDEMAQYVTDNYEELNIAEIEEMDDDKIADVLLSYYDAYLKFLDEGGDPSTLPEDPSQIIPGLGGGEDGEEAEGGEGGSLPALPDDLSQLIPGLGGEDGEGTESGSLPTLPETPAD